MLRGTLLLVALGAVLAVAGCLGTAGEDPDTAGADASDGLDRTTETRTFDGTVNPGTTATHDLEVGSDVVRFNATLDADAASMTLRGPDGDTVDAGDEVHAHGIHLERYGTGTYKLDVTAGANAGEVPYEVEADVVHGDRRPALDPEPVALDEPEDPGVVVALIDTGINPYHETFQREPAALPAAEDQASGTPALRVPVTDADELHEGLAEDDPGWRALERETLYRFEGTNVYGISMAPDDSDVYPVYDESGHGTATADTVLQDAPDATIVMVEVSATSWSEIADAIQWTSEQGWIDVVSASLGNPGNTANPLVAGGDPDLEVPNATEAVVDSGKVYVNSAGNDPTPHYTDNADGPPWVVAASGAEPTSRGRDVLPANGPDVVANFSVDAATHDSTSERAWIQGTSFSAPSTAGTLAQGLLQARRAADEPLSTEAGPLIDTDEATVNNHDLREALNRSAVYWDATDWDPTDPPGNDTGTQVVGTTAPFGPAPWTLAGWGYVNGSLADEMAAHVLGDELDPKPAPAQAYMAAQQDARSTYWDARLDG